MSKHDDAATTTFAIVVIAILIAVGFQKCQVASDNAYIKELEQQVQDYKVFEKDVQKAFKENEKLFETQKKRIQDLEHFGKFADWGVFFYIALIILFSAGLGVVVVILALAWNSKRHWKRMQADMMAEVNILSGSVIKEKDEEINRLKELVKLRESQRDEFAREASRLESELDNLTIDLGRRTEEERKYNRTPPIAGFED